MTELPSGWLKEPLKSLITLNEKFQDIDDATKCGFVPMNLVPTKLRGAFAFQNKTWSEYKKGYTHFKNGDVLLAKITPCFENGKSALVTGLPNNVGAGSTEYFVLRSHIIEPRYLHAFCKTKQFKDDCTVRMTGSVGHKRVPKDYLLEYSVPLAPLNEQLRIVDKLESLLANVDAAQSRIEKIPSLLKRFRQSVLAVAMSGELTRDWRESKAELENRFIDSRIDEYDGIGLKELPKKWCFQPFNMVADIKSNLVDPTLTPDAIHLAPNHIESNTARIIETVTVQQDGVKSNKHQFYSGQIIYSKIRPYLNKLAFVDFSGVCSADMYPIEAKINTRYLMYFMLSSQFVNWTSQKQGRVVLPKINQKALNKIPVVVPPAAEQVEIVRRIDELFSLADRVESQFKAASQRLDKLTQSILAKAFRGELVPQDDNDEPASLLLEQIKAEREILAKNKPKRAARRKSTGTKKEEKVVEMKLADVPEGYLSQLLEDLNGEADATVLWKRSAMNIDDFYAQLKKELKLGNLDEINDSADPGFRKLTIKKQK